MMSNVARNKRSRAVFRQMGSRKVARYTAPPSARTVRTSAIELKNIETNLAAVTPPVSAVTFNAPVLLNGSTQGTTAITRIGRQIKMRYLKIQHSIFMAATTTGGGSVRLIVFVDKQANAAAATAANVLETDSFVAQKNLGNGRRFRILYDVTRSALGTQGPQAISFTKTISLKGMGVEYNAGNSGGIGDIQTNSLYMMSAQSSGIATAAPTAFGNSRLMFSD